MALISGLALGFFMGLAIVFAFVMSENRRAQSRQQLAASTSAFNNASLDGLRRIFSRHEMPRWIVFPQLQKVNWLNSELRRIWPYVDKAASEMARSILEPILDQYRPPLISVLKFNKFTLGTVAPQFVGIKMLEDDENEVAMEVEIEWDGNPNIILGVTTAVGVSLPVQIKNAAFTGIFRVVFKPLVDEIPCFGAIMYSLRKKKKLDFKLKVIGGDISTVPGLAGAIDDMIKNALTDSLLWPVRQVIPVLPGDYSDLQLKVVGTLQVKLVQAKELQNKDLVGKSDPFARIFIRPIPSRTKRSKTVNNDLNPIWNEKYIFDVEDPDSQQLTVQIYDDEGVQSSELLGGALYSLKDLEPGVLKDVWLTLVKDLENAKEHKYRGQVQIELLYRQQSSGDLISSNFKKRFPLTSLEETAITDGLPLESPSTPMSSSAFSPQGVRLSGSRIFPEEEFTRGVLTVVVKRAENLKVADASGTSDPYAILRLKKSDQKVKTKVIYKTLNPEWNQTFDFVVEDAIHDILIIEIWDHDTFGKDYLGRVALTLSKVLLIGEFDAEYDLDGVKHGKLFLHMKWTPQPIAPQF